MMKNLDDFLRLLMALLAALATGLWLAGRGWPWYAWLPAAILAVPVMAFVHIVIWYIRRKTTYQALARRTKADLQSGGDGWTMFDE